MPKFIYVYKGPATDMQDMSKEQADAVMAAWNKWIDKAGKSLVDVGQPMANAISLLDNGKQGTPAQLNGYSIVEAADINNAKRLADGHPFLSEGKGKFAIDIYELLPVPM